MRILLAAPQDGTALGTIGIDCRDTLSALGHDVAVFDFRKRPYDEKKFFAGLKRAVRAVLPSLPSPYEVSGTFKVRADTEINRRLEELAAGFKPELVLVLCGENIFPETLERIRSRGRAVIANWFHDTLLLDYRQRLLQRVGNVYDILFIVDSLEVLKVVSIPCRKIESLPLACNPRVHTRREFSKAERARYGSDVAFVGTVTGPRQEWLEQLADFDLAIWGVWEKRSKKLHQSYRKQLVYGEEAAKVYGASRIVIDFHQLWQQQGRLYNVSPRAFEVPASGGFLITNDSVQIGELYDLTSEMAVYHDMEDLKRQIRYYLEHEDRRQAMADKAYERVQAAYTLSDRLSQLLASVQKECRCRE